MLNHFCHVELQTTEPEKAAELYKLLFGWKVERSLPGLDYWMIKTREGHDVGSVKVVAKIQNTGALNYVHVQGIDSTFRKGETLGAKVKQSRRPLANPEWGCVGVLETADGFLLGLWSKEGCTGVEPIDD
jgi:hypothetical protein